MPDCLYIYFETDGQFIDNIWALLNLSMLEYSTKPINILFEMACVYINETHRMRVLYTNCIFIISIQIIQPVIMFNEYLVFYHAKSTVYNTHTSRVLQFTVTGAIGRISQQFDNS